MGLVRNAFHKPGSVSLRGRDADGTDMHVTIRTKVSRFWKCAEFNCRLKPGQEARLNFRPSLRSVYIRLARAEGDIHTWPLAIGAGGAARIEDFDDEVRVFVPYSEAGYSRFVAPPDPTLHRISFEYQIRDDPVAQLSILEGVTKGRK
jgi:hypothetical protein